jgi:hypothetical protein
LESRERSAQAVVPRVWSGERAQNKEMLTGCKSCLTHDFWQRTSLCYGRERSESGSGSGNESESAMRGKDPDKELIDELSYSRITLSLNALAIAGRSG